MADDRKDDRNRNQGNPILTPLAKPVPAPTPAPFAGDDDDQWESELAAWDAALPLVNRAPQGPSQDPSPTADALPDLTGVVPEEENPFFDTPTTVVSLADRLDLEDLPEMIPAGAFDDGGDAPASGSYAALIATDESTPGIFDADPIDENTPDLPADILPEMTQAGWADIGRLISPGDGGTPAAPSAEYLQALAAVVGEERAFARAAGRERERDRERDLALALAAARLAVLAGHAEAAATHLDAALAIDGSSPAVHRARLVLAEHAGRFDDEPAAESLARLALTPHPDQPYYRSLVVEWMLARAARGIVDGTAAAAIASAPEGLGRMLAEVELVWRQPTAAAALLETAAERVGGGLGAALLVCAATMNELAHEYGAAARQRFSAARLDDQRAPAAPELIGTIRDVARLDANGAVPALEDLVPRFAPSPLKVSLARWGASAALRIGDGARARSFIADPAGLLGAFPGSERASAVLSRDRLDLWDSTAGFPADGLMGQVAAYWSVSAAKVCLALRACELALERETALGNAADEIRAALEAVEQVAGEGQDALALGAAVESLAAHAPDAASRVRALRLWRRLDPARWTAASLELAEALAGGAAAVATSVVDATESADSVLAEVVATDPTSLVFWRLAAREGRRGDLLAAAGHIDQGIDRGVLRDSPLAAPLAELAAELKGRAAASAVSAVSNIAAVAEAGAGARRRRRASGGEPKDFSATSGEAAALDPLALGAMLSTRPTAAAALVDRFAAGKGLPEGDRWVVAAAVAAAVAGDPQRALALAGTVPGAGAQLMRRLAWAAGDPERRGRLLRGLAATAGASAATFVEAAEAAEASGEAAEATRLFNAAAVAGGPDSNKLAEDVAAGLSRLSVVPVDASGDAAGAPTPRTTNRLDLLEDAVRSDAWARVVRHLVDDPPHEQTAGSQTLALAADIDEGRAGGQRARELWARSRAALKTEAVLGDDGLSAEPPALRRTGNRNDVPPAEMADALERLAAAVARVPDQRSAALYLLEAAQLEAGAGGAGVVASTAAGSESDVERRLRAAVAHDPMSAPAAIAWRRWLVQAGRLDQAATAAAAEAEALADPALRVEALLRAAAIFSASVGVDDWVGRAAACLHRALEIIPHHHAAFAKLRDLYEESGRHAALVALLADRLTATTNPFEVTALRLARAELFAGPLRDHPRAKAELEAILQKEPQHARALGRLADLEQEDGNDAGAADILIRRAFAERSPEKLRELFLRLGRIYTQRAPDAKRAVGAYSRVLQLDANNREALDELSRLYLGLGETKSAAAITERLARIETIPERRAAYHVRLGHLAERSGDVRAAAQYFRRAVEEAPRDIEALGELVRYLEKTRDTVGRRALLDGAVSDLRAAVLANPGDRMLLDALAAVLRWRGRIAAAAAAADLATMATTPVGGGAAVRLPDWAAPPPAGRRLAALAKPSVDDQTFGSAVPPAIRQLFRLLGPLLWEGGRPDVLSQFGVDRADRVPPGRPLRDVLDVVAGDLAAGPFEVFVVPVRSESAPAPLLVEPGRPALIVIGASLVGLGAQAVRFVAGRTLRLIATHLDMAVAGSAADLGGWLGGVIRQFVGDYRHPDVSDDVTAARAARVARLLPRKLRQEVLPFAMESSGRLDLEALRAGIIDGANRAGLVACGSVTAALRVILAASGEGRTHLSPDAIKRHPQAMTLLAFALSDEHDDLVRSLG